MVEDDLGAKAFGTAWGHTRSYANVLSDNAVGVNGNSWLVQQFKSLGFIDPQTGPNDPEKIVLVDSSMNSQWFSRPASGVAQAKFGERQQLIHSPAKQEFNWMTSEGSKGIFYDNTGADGDVLVGKLKAVVDNSGRRVAPDYDSEGRMTRFAQQADGQSSVFSYEHHESGGGFGRLAKAQLDVNGQSVRRAIYAYFGDEVGGNEGDLRSVSVEQFDGATGEWSAVAKKHYRYYAPGDSGGFTHGLKYVVKDATYQRMTAAGLNPETATEEQVASYADYHFEYDNQQRVVKERVNGGQLEINFAYLAKPEGSGFASFTESDTFLDVNTWATRTIESFPDGTENRVYTNSAGQLILKIFRETATGDQWYTYTRYNEDFQIILEATSAAVASVEEPDSDNGWTLTVNLKPSEGLVSEQVFYATTDPLTGAVEGYLQKKTVRSGESGTQVTLYSYTYGTHEAFGEEIHPMTSETNYPAPTTPAKTSYSYTWHEDENGDPTFQVKEKTTTFPVVSGAQNGSGTAGVESRIFDIDGRLIWLMDVRGAITYMAYDSATGAMTQKIEDVDTTQIDGVPFGWTTQPGWGLHLVTDYVNDALGRPVQARGPWHEVQLKESDETATSVRTVQFTAYLDAVHETRRATGYLTGDGPTADLRVVGAVRLIRTNASESVTDEIQCPRVCTCGPLTTGESFPQERWSRWKQSIYDPWNRLAATRVYHHIPASGEGSAGSDYLETTYGYDALDRQIRRIDPSGTIHRSVYDVRGLVTSEWTGTNDRNATSADPTGGLSAGNNMKAVALRQYDNEEAGGDGNLSLLALPVDDNPDHNRVTRYGYDFRNRLIAINQYVEGGYYYTAPRYDNLNRQTNSTTFAPDDTFVAISQNFYDLLGRLFKEITLGIISGAPGYPIQRLTWYDLSQNIIKKSEYASSSFTKTVYDALSRPTVSYLACKPGTAGIPAGDDNDITNDTVLEQQETVYDPAGNTILTIRRQRFDDTTGTGALQNVDTEPKARVTYLGLWPDSIGRVRNIADFGTNGGAALVRPTVAPDRSDTVLVTTNRFKDDGDASATIDPLGIETRWENDQAGRRIKLIENFVPGAPEKSRISAYTWHTSGNLQRLTLSNSITGEQVTRWIYGTTEYDSLIADNNLLRAKIYPESDDRPAPLDDGPDGVYARLEYSYNRQNQVSVFTDADGTVHEYSYDLLARPISDAVPVLGPDLDDSIRRIEQSYNIRGQLEKVTSYNAASGGSIVNQVALEYDPYGNISKDRQSHSGAVFAGTPEVTYSYANGSGNTTRRIKTTYPNGQGVDVRYGASNSIDDHLNRVSALQLTGAAETLVDYSYVGAGWQVRVGYAEPAVELTYKKQSAEPTGDAGDPYNGYDRFGRTVDMRWQSTEIGNSQLERIQYGFDRDSRRTWYKRALTMNEDQAYGYDRLSQVTLASRGNLNLNATAISSVPASEQKWNYDQTGNWSGYQQSTDGYTILEQRRIHDKGNRLTQIDGAPNPIILDRAGRMKLLSPDAAGDWNESLEVIWDAWNRIVQIKQNDGSIGAYTYDGLCRRITRIVNGVTWSTYYSESWRPLEERRDNQSTAAMQYYWGARHRDDLTRRDRATISGGPLDEKRYVLMDYFSPAAIVTQDGEVSERYSFSAFGLRRILQPNFSSRTISECSWIFGFHGQFIDSESALINYGFRYYSPMLGRWLSKDPIKELGGVNLYSYSVNDAVNSVDLLGLAENTCNCSQQEINRLAKQKGDEAEKESKAEFVKLRTLSNAYVDNAREYGGLICCNKKTSAVSSTGPAPGDLNAKVERGFTTYTAGTIDLNKVPQCDTLGVDWYKVADYHNHPSKNWNPGPGDFGYSLSSGGWPFFITTEGYTVRFDHITETRNIGRGPFQTQSVIPRQVGSNGDTSPPGQPIPRPINH